MSDENKIGFELDLENKEFLDSVKKALSSFDRLTKVYEKQIDQAEKLEKETKSNTDALVKASKETEKLSHTFRNNLSKSMDRIGKGLGTMRLALASFIADMASKALSSAISLIQNIARSIWNIGEESLKMAQKSEEAFAKFDDVFEQTNNQAKTYAKDLADNFNMASSEAHKLMGNTGALMQSFGFGEQESLKFSYAINKLAADVASFEDYSGGAEGASIALTKALMGEREMIKSLGIVIQEENVKEQVALERKQGLVFATEQQARANATLTLLLEKSANAHGDVARNMHFLSNQQIAYNNHINDLKEAIGKNLIPAMSIVVEEANKFLKANKDFIALKVNEYFIKMLERVIPLIKTLNTLSMVVDSISSAFKTLWSVGQFVISGITTIVTTLFSLIAKGINWIVQKIPIIGKEFKKVSQQVSDEISNIASASAVNMMDEFENIGTNFANIFSPERLIPQENVNLIHEKIQAIVEAANSAGEEVNNLSGGGSEGEKPKELTDEEKKQRALLILKENYAKAWNKKFTAHKQQENETDEQYGERRVQGVSDSMNLIAGLMSESNSTLFELGKASAIAMATIDGYAAVQKALASAPPPFNYALATAVGIASAANIGKIASQRRPEQKKWTGGVVYDGNYSGDRTTAYVNRGEVIMNPIKQANLLNRLASTSGNSNNNEALNEIRQLREEIKGIQITLVANDAELARSVSRGVQDGIQIGVSR